MELLLGPHVYDLPRVLLAEPLLEPIVVPDIFLPRLELVQRSLEDLDRAFLGHVERRLWSDVRAGPTIGMHDDGLLAGGDDAVHRVQHSAVDQLEKQDAGLGVHGLVCDGSLLLVLDAVLTLALFDGEVSDLVIHFVGELKGRND